jgi:hypothetical protein
MSWEEILKMPMGVNRSDRQKAGQLKIKIRLLKERLAKAEQQLAALNVPPRPRKLVGATTYKPQKEMEALLDKKLQGLITEEEFQAEKERLGE